jgi:hypothetical protein
VAAPTGMETAWGRLRRYLAEVVNHECSAYCREAEGLHCCRVFLQHEQDFGMLRAVLRVDMDFAGIPPTRSMGQPATEYPLPPPGTIVAASPCYPAAWITDADTCCVLWFVRLEGKEG